MDNRYFAAKQANEAIATILRKCDHWSNIVRTNGYLEKVKAAWAAYHGAYYDSAANGHKVTFAGENGELVNLPVNHIRNLCTHILNMTTSTRPTMEARSVNTDYKSLSQTILANGLLDYYMREKRLERYLKRAAEYAIVMGSGFIKLAWNATSGEVFEYNEELNTPIYEGDIEFSNMSPFDVIFDTSKEDQNHDWLVCRTWKNKFDLIAKYPELENKIAGLKTKTDMEATVISFESFASEDTDDVAVYEFYHKRSEALPDGRYILFLAEDTVLYDGPLPYKMLPVFRIAPADILGSPYGYTSVFDLLPLQEAFNSVISTVMTNNNAFGVQNILVPRGADINFTQLAGGLNVIEANIQAGKPEPLNLTASSPESYKLMDILRNEMEVLSGVNSVARGQPEASLKSGNALALVQSMAIQFMSGLQQSYVTLIEDVGTALIQILKDYAAVPRVAAIVGKNNKAFMKEFKGDDLNSINRVVVDVGNPLARTTAGRVQMAEQMLQMGIIKDPQQYFSVINTGKLEVMTEGTQTELLLVKGENEQLISGNTTPVLSIDDHKMHIQEHKSVLADPDLRRDPQLVQLVLSHIQEHIEALRTSDPALLGLLGQESLQAPPATQGAPQGSPSQQMQPPQEGVLGPTADQGELVGPGLERPQNIPSPARPPAPFKNAPMTPEEAMRQ